MLRKLMLAVAAVCTFGLFSCDTNDFHLQDEIVGSWSWIYEDDAVFEEEVYDFDPDGRWTYRYIYDNIFGEYIYEVDAGTYYVSYGKLRLESNFTGRVNTFSVNVRNDVMLLRDGDYYCEFLRYR
ncbi:MAG: hypothetical protein IKY73_06005 [Bacteroidaceae bacterium]|nr:hypothetical protein [Bacteroidaceae bacterium]